MTGVLAQRLVRRLCTCRYSSPPTQDYINSVMMAGLMESPKIRHTPGGCEECDFSGYRSRIGIYELLMFNDPIRQVTRTGNQNDEIRTLARQNGMRFMQEYGLELIRDGLTTLEELQRVVRFAQLTPETCGSCGKEVSAAFTFCPYCGKKKSAREWEPPRKFRVARPGAVNK